MEKFMQRLLFKKHCETVGNLLFTYFKVADTCIYGFSHLDLRALAGTCKIGICV